MPRQPVNRITSAYRGAGLIALIPVGAQISLTQFLLTPIKLRVTQCAQRAVSARCAARFFRRRGFGAGLQTHAAILAGDLFIFLAVNFRLLARLCCRARAQRTFDGYRGKAIAVRRVHPVTACMTVSVRA
jgi:hypothetical protein